MTKLIHSIKLGSTMKPLRKFFMEDDLEENRFDAKYNLGESGGRVRTVSELLLESGMDLQNIYDTFLNTKLCDSPNWGREDLRDIVSRMHPGSTRDNVLITTGTSEALFLLFRYLNPKSVALALPAFQLLYEIPMALKAKIIPLPVRWNLLGVPFIHEEEWIINIKKYKPACLLINNPHNPSGLILEQTFLTKLQKVARSINCTIIGDEHYRFLSSEVDVLGSTIYQNNKNTFVTGSFIKCFGAPGLRIGWCIGPHKALAHIQNEKNYTTHTVNPITEWISYEVLKNFNSLLFKNIKKDWIENKKNLKEYLSNSKAIYGSEPQGGLVTSLGFTNLKNLRQVQEKIKLLNKQGLFVLPLNKLEFGKFEFQNQTQYLSNKLSRINKGAGFRLGLGCRAPQLKEALQILTDI